MTQMRIVVRTRRVESAAANCQFWNYRVVGKWLKGVHPVSTGIVVSALARPEWLVEVDAIAVIPDSA